MNTVAPEVRGSGIAVVLTDLTFSQEGVTYVHMTVDDFPGLVFVVGVNPGGELVSFTARLPTVPTYRESEFPQMTYEIPPAHAELTARAIRRVPVGELLAMAVRHAREGCEWMADSCEGWIAPERELSEDGRLARIARDYVALVRDGQPAAAMLAERSGYDIGTVRNLVLKARRRGYLTAGPRGKQGGELTDKARAVLAEDG